MKNTIDLKDANIFAMIEGGKNLQFVKELTTGDVFTIEFVNGLGYWLTKTGETKGNVIDKLEVIQLFNTYCVENTCFEFYDRKLETIISIPILIERANGRRILIRLSSDSLNEMFSPITQNQLWLLAANYGNPMVTIEERKQGNKNVILIWSVDNK